MRYLLSILTLMALLPPLSLAEPLPWPSTPYSLYARQEPVGELLKTLGSDHGIAVVVSDGVSQRVNVSYVKTPPAKIFEELIKGHSLTWYYDGRRLYISPLEEMENQVVKLSCTTIHQFEAELRLVGAIDERFYWRAIPNRQMIYMTGPKRYLEVINYWLVALDQCDSAPQQQVTFCRISGTPGYTDDPSRCDHYRTESAYTLENGREPLIWIEPESPFN